MNLSRLSLNQWTTRNWSLREAADGCVRAGIPAIGLWREKVGETGIGEAVRIISSAGLRVSSLCRGGFFARDDAPEDNRRAVSEAAELGAECLVLVVGGMPDGSRDLPAARRRVAESLDLLVPYAAQHGVRLALEPLHPMYCADRAVLSTLDQALDLAEPYDPAHVGVVVDAFHVWWDPRVTEAIARAGERIASFQVCDWILPVPADLLLARGMMGDGIIDLRALRRAVDAAGYDGDIEVEIFNADIWATDGDEVLATMCRRYIQHVL